MKNSFGYLAHMTNDLEAPLKASSKQLLAIIEDYKKRNFEYISYKDFRNIFNQLEKIHSKLQSCSVAMNSILVESKRKVKLDPGSTDINSVLNDILHTISKKVKFNIEFKSKLYSNLPHVALGHGECHQILSNILSNSVQSMPAGGVIKIKTMLDVKEKKVIIDIKDQGIGMPKEVLDKIYEPSQNGFGLAIIHSIVTLCGGSIKINSSLRKGTDVRLSLPVFS